jgi:endonuclease/exonuclease/phosphatase family metal-dependent hydrolase
MKWRSSSLGRIAAFLGLLVHPCLAGAETFRVATYNVESYLDEPTQSRQAKSAEAKAKVRDSILAIRPEVIALQEIGTTNALLELRDSLKAAGLALPHWEHVAGFDTNIHIAILSKYPFLERHPHTNDSFLLNGRRFRVSRGFGDVLIQVNPNYSFNLLVAHLKSKRTTAQADEAELRFEEAKLLREKIDAHLTRDNNADLLVVGDFNDSQDSPAIKVVIGRGKRKLLDLRPAERNGDDQSNPSPTREPRNVTWTHYYAKEDLYSRVDFILVSSGLAHNRVTNETYVLTMPNWGSGSDHRPIVATFAVPDQ